MGADCVRLAPLFSSATPSWATPKALYEELDGEFHFTLDPCPIGGWDGLLRSWLGERVYCNPPYGNTIAKWLIKAREAELAVYLLPSRTDTRWWHEFVMKADEIRFIKGRLKFGEAKHSAPFPSAIVIYRTRTTGG
jgi:site-specific DNA-methyltransferase (adenine-specific)